MAVHRRSRPQRRQGRSAPDWIGRGIALASLGVWIVQLLFGIADRQGVSAENLLVELLPAAPGGSVELLCHPDGKVVVVGFPFEGRILNVGKSAITATSWLLEGITEGAQTESQLAFQGATVFLRQDTGEKIEMRFPFVLPPGESVRFGTSLRVTVVDPQLVSALTDLARGYGGSLSVSRLEKALPDGSDLCGNSSLIPLGLQNNGNSWIRVRLKIWTLKGRTFEYAFLWAPPSRVEQGEAVSGLQGHSSS